jgi:signal transduction histidine kinase
MRSLALVTRWVRGLDPLVADGLLAALLSVAALIQVWAGETLPGYREPGLASVAIALLINVPLMWRRRAPLVVLAVVFAATAVGDVTAVPYGQGFGLILALYTVASACEPRRAIPAFIVVTLGVLVLLTAGALWAPQPVTLDLFFLNLLVIGITWAIGDNVRTRRAYTAELEDRAARLERQREADARAAAASERARIARELHDVVAHHVSVMAVQAGAARRVVATQPDRARDAVEAIEGTARQALTELRRLLGVLRRGDRPAGPEPGPALAPQPGLGELEALAEQARRAGLRFELVTEGEPRPLPAAIDLSAYRIVQEALTNTLKHANAARARIAVRYGRDEVELTVADDGRGIVDADELAAGGHGLIGMRERVALFGGDLTIGPRPGGGLRVAARLPVEADIWHPPALAQTPEPTPVDG